MAIYTPEGFFFPALYQPFTLLWHAETKREMYSVRAAFPN